jgi:hypothetical protein
MSFLSRSLAALLVCAAAAPAQILISEINFKPQQTTDDQWIELVNLGANKLDLSSWSLYQATNTNNAPQNYWFGFPPGTEIQPGKYLRVHWFVPVKPNTSTDIYTGDTIWHFLFGYGAEALHGDAGAIALVSTQQNLLMNSPTVYVDWVGWGVNGLRRENLAIQNGRWISNQKVGIPVEKDSIALDYSAQTEPTPASAFFHDVSPTPGDHNHEMALVETYGTTCGVGNVGAPGLSAVSIPAVGNRDFGLRIDNTAAGNNGVLLFASGQGNGSLTFGPCKIWLDPATLLVAQGYTTTFGQTTLPLPIPVTLSFGTVFVQSVVILQPPTGTDFGFSNGLRVRLSY